LRFLRIFLRPSCDGVTPEKVLIIGGGPAERDKKIQKEENNRKPVLFNPWQTANQFDPGQWQGIELNLLRGSKGLLVYAKFLKYTFTSPNMFDK
jgi:hypothetical protein